MQNAGLGTVLAMKFFAAYPAATIPMEEVDATARLGVEPFERAADPQSAEGPFQVQHALQEMMQELVGIVRREEEMRRALDGIESLKARAARVGVTGNREYNPGWHTALDLRNLLTVAEAITRSALERKESRGGHFRDDFPEKDPAAGSFNIVITRGPGDAMTVSRVPIPPMRDDLKKIIEENR